MTELINSDKKNCPVGQEDLIIRVEEITARSVL